MSASSSEVQELLARLVAFDTTSAKSNLELIAFVKTYLDGYGVASTLIPSADGAKRGGSSRSSQTVADQPPMGCPEGAA